MRDLAVELDERLSAIARMVPVCENVADIGTDHGFLGVHLLEIGRCERVQFADISEVSLKKAKRLALREGYQDRAAFSLGDGAQALVERADCAVIAGMGGVTIAGIVRRGMDRLRDAALIMQPNVGAEVLRRELMAIQMRIVDEDIVRAGNRWYVIIKAEAGRAELSARELLAGPVILARNHPNLPGYARFRLRVAQKAHRGAVQGDPDAAAALYREATMWEEMIRHAEGDGSGY